MSDTNNGTAILLAFLAGAATGAAVTFLTAPQSGRETRETLHSWADEARGKAGRLPHAMGSAYRRAAAAAKEAFIEAYNEETVPTP